jgi:hypothetical protein
MPLEPDPTCCPDAVTARLGEGGMGEVWRVLSRIIVFGVFSWSWVLPLVDRPVNRFTYKWSSVTLVG